MKGFNREELNRLIAEHTFIYSKMYSGEIVAASIKNTMFQSIEHRILEKVNNGR